MRREWRRISICHASSWWIVLIEKVCC